MCGIIISNLEVPEKAKKTVKKRGPDSTKNITYKGINFYHFLLHLTGKSTPQPIIDSDVVYIFNGEIYNYKELLPDAESDIYSIINVYKKYGDNFIKYLDGEYVIVIFDFKKDKIIISSDIFKTKPLFYKIDQEDIIISSYESACKEIKNSNYNSIRPNEILFFSISERKLIKREQCHVFDLNQKKDNYDDFFTALENAFLKRYPENSYPLITLSSGMDSGAIACCLKKYNKKCVYVSIPRNENITVLKKRKEILGDQMCYLNLSYDDKKYWKTFLKNNCEEFVWDWTNHPRLRRIKNGFDAGSMLGKCKIIRSVINKDPSVRVLFSGIGADEIMSINKYYSNGWGNVNYFPENLSEVYPWPNFFNGSMENYIKGDEYIGGCFGYETRYPFCDKDLVQEFLWLKPSLKNKYKNVDQKPVLFCYLEKEGFPVHTRKLGFDP